MEYRQLGKSGLRVSVIGLGTNRFGYARMPQEEVNRVMAAAGDLGINFIDSANIYQGGRSEETLGVALQGRRDRFVLATKFMQKVGEGPNDWGASRGHMTQALDASLKRLQTDYIDLYYVHRYDDTTPIEETLRALDDAARAGKIRYLGASNFMAWQLARANLLAEVHGWLPFVVTQEHYHLFERSVETEMLPFCQAQGVGLIPFFPLAGGFLTGKYKQGQAAPPGSRGESSPYVQQYMTPANYAVLDRLQNWAEGRGHNLTQLAHAWLLSHPEVSSVISGATRLEQVEQNVHAAGWALNPEEAAEIEEMLKGE